MRHSTNIKIRVRLIMICLAFSAGASHAALDSSLLEGLSARALGPAAVSGRITAIDAVSSDPNRIVIGAATGGVWISENGGLTWTPVFDEQAVASIGSIAINQSNPDILILALPEICSRTFPQWISLLFLKLIKR